MYSLLLKAEVISCNQSTKFLDHRDKETFAKRCLALEMIYSQDENDLAT